MKALADVSAFEKKLPASDKRKQKHWDELRERLVAALASVGLGTTDEKALLPAKSLTAAQRGAVEWLAAHPEIPTGALGIPVPSWAKRQWLGLDKPGPLFRDKEPLLARVFAADDEDAVIKLIGKLPIADRIEAMVDLQLIDSFDYDLFEEPLLEALPKMPKTMGAWGERLAARLTASAGKPWEYLEGKPEAEVGIAVLYALVQAGIELEPAWDKVLQVEHYPFEPARRVILAIPEERREHALLDALPKSFPYDLDRARALLKEFPYPSIARYVLANLKRSNRPKDVIKELSQIPGVADVLAARKPAPKLQVLSRSKPKIKELDANAKKQVEQSAKRFDERKESAADLLAGKGEEPLAPFELVKIADEKGKLAYEAWLHLIDAGSIYKAGTAKLVAQIIQDGVECEDDALREAFSDVIRAKPARKKR